VFPELLEGAERAPGSEAHGLQRVLGHVPRDGRLRREGGAAIPRNKAAPPVRCIPRSITSWASSGCVGERAAHGFAP